MFLENLALILADQFVIFSPFPVIGQSLIKSPKRSFYDPGDLIVSQFLVRLEKTVPDMVTGCLRMIKSAIFACR